MISIECFEQIFLCHNKDVLYFLLGLTGNDYSLAEEIMQETFFQAYRSIGKFQGDSTVKTWLFAIAKNLLFAHYRKNRPNIPLEQIQNTNAAADAGFEHILENRDLLEKTLLLIVQMPTKKSDVLVMRAIENLPYSVIASRLSIKENSARVLFMRARTELHKQLKEVYGYELAL